MSQTEIIPLGTGSAVPVPGRSFSAVALRRAESVLLFDCGEGTQSRLLDAGIRTSRIATIFLTHLHGDHFFGLFGLLTTMSLLHRESPISVVCPAGLGAIMESLPGLRTGELSFDVEFFEIPDAAGRTLVVDHSAYRVWCAPLDHGVPAFGYRYQEYDWPGSLDVELARQLGVSDHADFRRLKSGEEVAVSDGSVVRPEQVVGPSSPGAVFAYVTDSRPCGAAEDLARGADILYHEATFGSNMPERAHVTGHSTTTEAAQIALAAGARRLLLSHFSARYRDFEGLVAEARSVFAHAEAAVELNRYRLQKETIMTEDLG